MNKARLLKLVNYISKLPNRKWDFDVIRHTDFAWKKNGGWEYKCASIGCACGWMPSVFPNQIELKIKYGGVELAFKNRLPSTDTPNLEVITEFLGLSNAQAEAIFGLHSNRRPDLTKREWLQSVRNFIKTGTLPNFKVNYEQR